MAIPDPTIYNLDYQQAGNLLSPPDKRQPVYLAFLNACLSPLQWLRDLIFNDYANGSSAALYSSAVTYSYGNRVVWTDFGVWEYISSAPGSAAPGSIDANGDAYWYQVLKNFQGLRLRARVNSQKLLLEHALNDFFKLYGSVFVQPTGTCNAIPNTGFTGTATGTNTYTITLSAVSSYQTGQVYKIIFTNASTSGALTLNVNSLGAITINVGSISAGQTLILIYNGISFDSNTIFTYPDGSQPATCYPKSSIFIGTNKIDANGFIVGLDSNNSSAVIQTDKNAVGADGIGDAYLLDTTQYNFTVWVPASLYDNIGLKIGGIDTDPITHVNSVTDGLILSYIAQYAVYGLTYNVKRY